MLFKKIIIINININININNQSLLIHLEELNKKTIKRLKGTKKTPKEIAFLINLLNLVFCISLFLDCFK